MKKFYAGIFLRVFLAGSFLLIFETVMLAQWGTIVPISLANQFTPILRAGDSSYIPIVKVGAQAVATPIFTFSIDSVPPGMGGIQADDYTIALEGTPTKVGTFRFKVTVYDQTNDSAYIDVTVTVVQPMIHLNLPSGVGSGSGSALHPYLLPPGTYGYPYDSAVLGAFGASGGTPAYTFSIPSMPWGMGISSNGWISGTPTGSGTIKFQVFVSDETSGPGSPYTGGGQWFQMNINQAPLNITASDTSKVYGAAMPSLSLRYSGFVNGDDSSSLTTAPAIRTTATPASPVGKYDITVSDAASTNYTITYGLPGTLTVNPAPLTIIPVNDTMTYGGEVPALSARYQGFVNGDSTLQPSQAPALSTTATSSSPAGGAYRITAGGAVDSNYAIWYDTGTMVIAKAPVTVTANPETKAYGTPDPIWKYTVSGFVNGDSSSTITGSPGRIPGEKVGVYPITQGTLSADSNYVIDFTGNDLTITKAPQVISWVQTLSLGCDSNATQFQLNATSTSGLPVSYSTADSGVATIAGDLLTLLQPATAVITATQPGDSNYFAAPAVTDTTVYLSQSFIRQHWADVIFFDNSSDKYVQWQWYKNNDAVPGAVYPYYSEPPALNGQYYVVATDTSGHTIRTCELTINSGGAVPWGIKVFPNPASPGSPVSIVCNYSAASLQGARMLIADMSGKIWQQVTNVQPSMQVAMPAIGGIYVINLLLSNGQKASVNVLVNF